MKWRDWLSGLSGIERYPVVKRLSFLVSALLLSFMGIFSSGCLENETEVNCAKTFCIGTLLPEDKDSNISRIEAVNLAKSDINNAGGTVEIISGNSYKSGMSEVSASAKRLYEMGVHGIVGPTYSEDSSEILSFLSENQVVAISPSSTSHTLTVRNKEVADSGNQIFFFRIAPSDLFQAPILAKQSQGRTIIVNRDDRWGEDLAALVREEIMSYGRMVRVVSYDSDAPSAASVVSDVEANMREIGGVDSIIMLVFEEGGEITRGLLDSSVIPEQTGYYFGDGILFEESLFPHVEEEDGEIKGFRRVSSVSPPGKRLEEFKGRFSADTTFNNFAAHAYDAAVILSLAALSAGSNDPSDYAPKIKEVTREGVKCRSYATCAAALTDETSVNDDIDYEGLSGPIDLNDNGDITAGLYVVDTYDAKGAVRSRLYLNFVK